MIADQKKTDDVAGRIAAEAFDHSVEERKRDQDERRRARKKERADASVKAGRMDRQLQHWGARLEELLADVEHVGSRATTEYRERIADLKAKHELVHSKLKEVRAAGTMAYRGLSAELNSAWSELAEAFKKLKS